MGHAATVVLGIASAGALAGILVGLLAHRVIGDYIEGAISAYGCIVYTGLLIGLISSVAVFRSWWLLLTVSIAVAVWLVLSKRTEVSDRSRFYEERVRQYREALEADPNNLAARSRAADALYKLGHVDEAIEQYSEVVRLAPGSTEEAHRLKQLLRERDDQCVTSVLCPECRHRNPKGRLHCADCEASLETANRMRISLEAASLSRYLSLIAAWATVVTVVLLLGSALSPIQQMVAASTVMLVVLIAFLVRMHVGW